MYPLPSLDDADAELLSEEKEEEEEEEEILERDRGRRVLPLPLPLPCSPSFSPSSPSSSSSSSSSSGHRLHARRLRRARLRGRLDDRRHAQQRPSSIPTAVGYMQLPLMHIQLRNRPGRHIVRLDHRDDGMADGAQRAEEDAAAEVSSDDASVGRPARRLACGLAASPRGGGGGR